MKKEILRALKSEIEWCKKNPTTDGQQPLYEKGFIKGLQQAVKIVREVHHLS